MQAQIQIDVGLEDQADVTYHGHRFLHGEIDDLRRFLCGVRDDDERFDATVEERLRLLQLLANVALGGFDEHVAIELLRAFVEEIAIALPALVLGVLQESNLRSWLLRLMRRPARR